MEALVGKLAHLKMLLSLLSTDLGVPEEEGENLCCLLCFKDEEIHDQELLHYGVAGLLCFSFFATLVSWTTPVAVKNSLPVCEKREKDSLTGLGIDIEP